MIKPNEDDWRRAALVCREVAELPDRTSSDLNPDEMIVTGDELQPIVAGALADARERWEAERGEPSDEALAAACSAYISSPHTNLRTALRKAITAYEAQNARMRNRDE